MCPRKISMNASTEGQIPSQVEFSCLSMKSNIHCVEQGAQALTFDVPEPIVCFPAERIEDFSNLVEGNIISNVQWPGKLSGLNGMLCAAYEQGSNMHQ